MRVVFCKYPKDAKVKIGESLTLKAEALCSTGSKCIWEADLGKGWKKVREGKVLTITSIKKAHEGNYRCVIAGVSSRVAAVEVQGEDPKSDTNKTEGSLEILKKPSEVVEETVKKASKKTSKKTSK